MTDLLPDLRQQLGFDPLGESLGDFFEAGDDDGALLPVRPFDQVEQKVEELIASLLVVVVTDGEQQQRDQLVTLGQQDVRHDLRQLVELGSGYALHQVFGCSTTHAYLHSTHSINSMLSVLPTPESIWKWIARHRAIDRFLSRNLSPELKVTALSPSLIVQRPCFSDIVGKEVAACAENHQTKIEPLNPNPQAFDERMRSQVAALKRSDRLDQLRSLWKNLCGF